MATGNKTVRTRMNKASRIANRVEKRGGVRKGTGPKPKIPDAKMTVQIFARLEKLSKAKGTHWMDQILGRLWDGDEKEQARLGRQILDMLPSSILKPNRPFIAPMSGDDQPVLSGPPKLPPLKPDPAKAA